MRYAKVEEFRYDSGDDRMQAADSRTWAFVAK
jgi:hypothetical protein